MTRGALDAADNKSGSRLLAKLRSALDEGDIAEVSALLSGGVNSDILVRIREQKFILRAPLHLREEVAELLRTAGRGLESAEQAEFDSYLEFALAIDAARRRCLERVHAELTRMPRCSKADLLIMGQEVLSISMARLMRGADIHAVEISVAERERRLHDLNGAANDLVMAVARVVNECARVGQMASEVHLGEAQRHQAIQVLLQALTPAGETNSLEWFFDSVSYGEFKVDKAQDTIRPTYRLHFVDSKRYLLKTLAIRRSLIVRFVGQRNPRFVRDKLKEMEPVVLEQAVAYYLWKAGCPASSRVDLARAHSTSSAMLMEVDAEDDLLVAASHFDPRVLAHYVVSMALRWHSAAAESVRLAFNIGERHVLEMSTIPMDLIARSIGGIDEKVIAEALENLTLDLPARSHVSLENRPFVRDGAGVARPFLQGGVGSWTSVVRESLIQGGAIGKSVGAIWEDFCANSFDGSEWKVVGRGVKLRSNGQTLTDVDLLLLREDLLLVMQIKGLVGLANTPYHHWRNRQTIQLGCSQAQVATNFLRSDLNALVSICGKRSASVIRYIQPVVLTNIHQLDGWRFNDVPVISEVTRKAICRGARVDYRDSHTGAVLHTHHFVSPENLTTESILQLMQQSIEMQIAAEGTETSHSVHDVGELRLLMPEFVMRSNSAEVPPHEPSPGAWRQGADLD